MAALDEISKVHPVIAAVVLAFKAVVNLELKRRETDERVIALQLQIQSMMTVLLQLGEVRDPNQKTPDGRTIEGRLQNVMQGIAEDITACGNACDSYVKKSLIVRVLKSPIYEARFGEFAILFADRQKELELALLVHTTLEVDSVGRILANVDHKVRTINEKLNIVMLFSKLRTPRERELLDIVESKGGIEACIENDAILEELLVISRDDTRDSSLPLDVEIGETALTQLKQELNETVNENFQRNMLMFEKKLDDQKRDLVGVLTDTTHRESDRVISAVVSGPHDSLIDPVLQHIWKEMSWKGNVDTTTFVLTLGDYFQKMIRDENMLDPIDLDLPPIGYHIKQHAYEDKGEQWTFAYINMLNVQPVVEAFDFDMSGFISIREANEFTSSKPKDWSLARFLAYWAAGWHLHIWDYRRQMRTIIEDMSDARQYVLPINRALIDEYLGHSTFARLGSLMRSVQPCPISKFDRVLKENVKPFVDEELSSISQNLQSTSHEIQTHNQLISIIGPGPIERRVFPLLLLLLKYHFHIIRMSRAVNLHEHELQGHIHSLDQVFRGIDLRTKKLLAIFKQRNLNVKDQISKWAFGMFRFVDDPTPFEDPTARYRDQLHHRFPRRQSSMLNTSLLKFGAQQEFDYGKYALQEPPNSGNFPFGIDGFWTGHYVLDAESGRPWTRGMVEITIGGVQPDGSFQGRGHDLDHVLYIRGSFHAGKKSFIFTLTKEFSDNFYSDPIWCVAALDSRSPIIVGHWGLTQGHISGTLRLTQSPAILHGFQYSEEGNWARARWLFAFAAIKKQLWCWSYFKGRFSDRRRFVELLQRRDWSWRYKVSKKLTPVEQGEIFQFEQFLPHADYHLYHHIACSQWRTMVIHRRVPCDTCSGIIKGPRIVCLRCISGDRQKQIDLCIRCIYTKPVPDHFAHDVDHPLVKFPIIIHDWEKRDRLWRAKMAVQRLGLLFRTEEINLPASEGDPVVSSEVDYVGNVNIIDSSDAPSLCCGYCDKPVSLPCWFCVSCYTEPRPAMDFLVCDKCESRSFLIPKRQSHSIHKSSHPLVRHHPNSMFTQDFSLPPTPVVTPAKVPITNDLSDDSAMARDAVLLEKLSMLESRHSKVEERLTSMEDLLNRVVAKLDA